MKYARLTDATYAGDYRIHVVFKDGVNADIDVSDQLWGEVFEPLKDQSFFRQLRFDNEIRTVVWPNGADMAPEFLYERAKQAVGQQP
ncbi:MAG: DUF2442 domain-containing protein [Alphaproteobacteria bacterium]|nr:DUF2442 domain-containing protein [Alphaproteobacteria bacterium]